MTPMLARTRTGLAVARATLASPVVLVPTMGALHNGHRALLRTARAIGPVVVSVFVNPLQFSPGEDLDRYPRAMDHDMAVCAEEGVALVFAPRPDQMYPGEQRVRVDPGPVGDVLEGAARPGHFGGMLTVVLKLFGLVRPDAAVFGEKDAQQLFLVRQMVSDLNVPVRIVPAATIREPDGLALATRNAYLSAAERQTALAISRALRAGRAAACRGGQAVLAAAQSELAAAAAADPPLAADYLELVQPDSFTPVPAGYAGPALLLVAGRVGRTRLIDSMTVEIGARA